MIRFNVRLSALITVKTLIKKLTTNLQRTYNELTTNQRSD